MKHHVHRVWFFVFGRHGLRWHNHGAVPAADLPAVEPPNGGSPRPTLRAARGSLSLNGIHLARFHSPGARHGRRWLFAFPRSLSVEMVDSAPASVRGGLGKPLCRVPMRNFPLDISSSLVQFGLSAKRYLETEDAVTGPVDKGAPLGEHTAPMRARTWP